MAKADDSQLTHLHYITPPQKRTLEQLIEDALLKEDMGLLYVICDSSTVVGDAAAMWSKGILKVLGSRVDKDAVQSFLKRALRNRILDYSKREKRSRSRGSVDQLHSLSCVRGQK